MNSPTQKTKKINFKKWLRHLAIDLIVIFTIPVVLFSIGWYHRNLLIDSLQDWYREHHQGTLEIGKVDASFLSGFPNIGFTLTNILQTSHDTISGKKNAIHIERAQVTIGASDLLIGRINLKNINIKKAEVFSEVVSDKPYEYHVQLKLQNQKKSGKGLKLPSWLHPERTDFSVHDINFVNRDTILNKNFDLEIHRINGHFKENQLVLNGGLDFDITVNALGFNTEKGNYLTGVRVKGTPKFQIDQKSNLVRLSEFLIHLDHESYRVEADLDFNSPASYNFSFQNDNTDFQALKGFLPKHLNSKLSIYTILDPFETILNLAGKFQFGDIPDVYAEFSTRGNKAVIKDSTELADVSFNGLLTNTIYENDSLKSLKASRKDIKLFFKELTAKIEDINLAATDSYYQTSIDANNFLDAKIAISGPNKTLAKVLKTNNFDFLGGSFDLKADILGDITQLHQIFDFATGSFHLNDTKVILKKNGLQLPVETLDLTLNNEHSILDALEINLPNGENLIFTGRLKNASSIISDNTKKTTTSQITLDAPRLHIDELIATAKELIPKSRHDSDNRHTLHQTLDAIYTKFQPRFKLNLGTLTYNSIDLSSLSADITLSDPETVSVNDFAFNYAEATTELRGTFKVPEPKGALKEPVFIDVQAKSRGPIDVFQDMFNIELVDIVTGNYHFMGSITGNLQKFEQLLHTTKGHLMLENAKFHYRPAGFDIAFDSLSIKVGDSNIDLDRVKLEIGELYPFILNGRVERFPGILLDEIENKGRISIQLNAPYVDGNQWITTLNSLKDDEREKELDHKDIDKVFKDIYKLNPKVQLAVDSLKFRNLTTKDLRADVHFENDSILKLDYLTARYKDSEVQIEGFLKANNVEKSVNSDNPFDFNFSAHAKGKTIDLNDYLQTVNFVFESGDFEFNGSYQGHANDLKILNANAYGDLKLGKSKVNFKAADLQIPVDSLYLNIQNDLATVKTLDIDLPGKSILNLTGTIDNFSSFINNSKEKDAHTSTFNIKSPYISIGDIMTLLETTEKVRDSISQNIIDITNYKDALSAIHKGYYPSMRIEVDSLINKDISIFDFGSEIGFDQNGNFKIEDTQLNFFGGKASLAVIADLESQHLPVEVAMKVENIQLGQFAESMNYFNDEHLKQAEKIDGDLTYILNGTAILNADGSLNMDSLNGSLNLNLKNMALYNYKPIMENALLMKEERFEKLRFRPIEQTFKVIDGKLIVPRTEIQSSALHLFVEGLWRLGKYMNIWLSLPWKNLKSKDGLTLPEKTSYDEAGAKFHIQLIQDKLSEKPRKRELKTKFRLGNRKMKRSLKNH